MLQPTVQVDRKPAPPLVQGQDGQPLGHLWQRVAGLPVFGVLHIAGGLAVQHDVRPLRRRPAGRSLVSPHGLLRTVQAVKALHIGLRDIGQLTGARTVAHGHGARAARALEREDRALRQRHQGPEQVQHLFGHGMAVGQAQLGQQGTHLRQGHIQRAAARRGADPKSAGRGGTGLIGHARMVAAPDRHGDGVRPRPVRARGVGYSRSHALLACRPGPP